MSLPTYKVFILTGNKQYDVTNAITALQLSEPKNQLAQAATVKIVNVQHNGTYLTGLFDVIDRVSVFATYDGETDEVFRGFVWDKDYTSSDKKELSLVCYDNLIYMQKSQICEYFTAGKTTESICSTMFDNWGVKLSFAYKNITHPKLPLDGSFADALIDDVLNDTKKQTGAKYVIRSVQDVVHIKTAGSNKKIYKIVAKQNSGDVTYKKTMEDVITKVVITGAKDDNDKTPIEATVSGKTSEYGTIQKIISKDKDTSIADSKKEAQEMLDENGTPKEIISINDAVDIPFVHKGDVVEVTAGNIVGRTCLVTDVSHDAVAKVMDLELEFYNIATSSDNASNGNSGGGSSGKELKLSGVALYFSADAKTKAKDISGTYYLYDGVEKNGRYRITNSSSRVGKTPIGDNVTGWIDKENV